MNQHFSNEKKITQADWKAIDNYVKKLKISLQEAIELREFDKFGTDQKTEFEKEQKDIKKEKNKKNTITSEENLKFILEIIQTAFRDKTFKSKDLHLLVADKFTNRQTPHALTKLHKEGYLELIEGKSPKTYKIKE